MKLSIVIPARNEAKNLPATVEEIVGVLRQEKIPFEIVVVNDHSSDDTGRVLDLLSSRCDELCWISNENPGGFGYAVRAGLRACRGDAMAIMMADSSDLPADLVAYYRVIESGKDCSFGSRFISGSRVSDYPFLKLILNRFANTLIRFLFGIKYNDVTNAFKMYRREVIEGSGPFFSRHFNLTVELPLKAIVRGYSWEVIPIGWKGRKWGLSKLKIREMGSRYLFVILTVLLEKWLAGKDYSKTDPIRETLP